MSEGPDHLSKAEIGKDVVQAAAESAISTVGEVATIITGAVRDVAGALGGFATDVFETVDASRRAASEHAEPASDTDDPADPAEPV